MRRLQIIIKFGNNKTVQTGSSTFDLQLSYQPYCIFTVTRRTNVHGQHYLRRGGSAQPVKRHCGIAVSLRPGLPSPGSWSSDLGRGGGDTLWFSFAGFILPAPNLLVLYLYFFFSDWRPSTCPDGPSPLARVCNSWFCMTCLGAKGKKEERERERERLAFVVCLIVENEAWRAGAGGSASPLLLLLWAGLDYRAWDLYWQHRQTKRDCELRQEKESLLNWKSQGEC